MKLAFTIYGTPQPQGSARAFMPKDAKYPVITSDNPKLRSWRQELAKAALVACHESHLSGTSLFNRKLAFYVEIRFYFKPVKRNAKMKTTRPDADKLLRAALDGMSGIVYHDDAQVSRAQVWKEYGLPERTEVLVETI